MAAKVPLEIGQFLLSAPVAIIGLGASFRERAAAGLLTVLNLRIRGMHVFRLVAGADVFLVAGLAKHASVYFQIITLSNASDCGVLIYCDLLDYLNA